MPIFEGPPCNKFWFKARRPQYMPDGSTHVSEDPEDPKSGCYIEFDEAGFFDLPAKGKYMAEKWKDVFDWIVKLPEWGRTIRPANTDSWWQTAPEAKAAGVSFEEDRGPKMRMKMSTPRGDVVRDAVKATKIDPEELEIKTVPQEALAGGE